MGLGFASERICLGDDMIGLLECTRVIRVKGAILDFQSGLFGSLVVLGSLESLGFLGFE